MIALFTLQPFQSIHYLVFCSLSYETRCCAAQQPKCGSTDKSKPVLPLKNQLEPLLNGSKCQSMSLKLFLDYYIIDPVSLLAPRLYTIISKCRRPTDPLSSLNRLQSSLLKLGRHCIALKHPSRTHLTLHMLLLWFFLYFLTYLLSHMLQCCHSAILFKYRMKNEIKHSF
jgi:hypothetical protein